MPQVLVPPARWERWWANFERSHGPAVCEVVGGALLARAEDGSRAEARLPFAGEYAGPADPVGMLAAHPGAVPGRWGVLLVRKGGFAVARVQGGAIEDSKVGQRHVQGRTKAGGQSQQRFARRRDNQARQAYEAAAEHAVRILGAGPLPVVAGGDRTAVEEVLADPRLSRMRIHDPWLAVPDPRRAVLEQAVADATPLRISVTNVTTADEGEA